MYRGLFVFSRLQEVDTMELLTRREVEAMVRLGRSAIYRLMREGRFPLPIVVGARSVRWRSGEISQYLESRPRASGDTA